MKKEDYEIYIPICSNCEKELQIVVAFRYGGDISQDEEFNFCGNACLDQFFSE